MEKYTGWLHNLTNIEQNILWKIVITIALLVVLKVIHLIILKVMFKNIEEPRRRYRWKKTLIYIFVFIGFLVVGRVWFQAFQSFATFLGLLTAGLAIFFNSSNDISSNLLSEGITNLRSRSSNLNNNSDKFVLVLINELTSPH